MTHCFIIIRGPVPCRGCFRTDLTRNWEYSFAGNGVGLGKRNFDSRRLLSPKVFRLNQFEEIVPVAFHNLNYVEPADGSAMNRLLSDPSAFCLEQDRSPLDWNQKRPGIVNLGLTPIPLLTGAGFLLSGVAGVMATPTLLWLRHYRVARVLGALLLLSIALIWAATAYPEYWLHFDMFSKWQPR